MWRSWRRSSMTWSMPLSKTSSSQRRINCSPNPSSTDNTYSQDRLWLISLTSIAHNVLITPEGINDSVQASLWFTTNLIYILAPCFFSQFRPDLWINFFFIVTICSVDNNIELPLCLFWMFLHPDPVLQLEVTV